MQLTNRQKEQYWGRGQADRSARMQILLHNTACKNANQNNIIIIAIMQRLTRHLSVIRLPSMH